MAKRSFTRFVEQELGKFPHFIIYAVLEWVLIFFLFIDGFIAFFTNEFAKFFDLRTPCLLCTRIDHVLVHRNPDFYYNDSICESHKKDVSSLAYCHNHKKLSDIRKMCESCLLSFATEKESDCDTYKSLIGILHKDLDCFLGEDQVQLSLSATKDEGLQVMEKSNSKYRCACCGNSMKMKSSSSSSSSNNKGGRHASLISQGPTPSPRAPFVNSRGHDHRGLELPHIRYTELKFISDNESELPEDDDASQRSMSDAQLFKEDVKAASVPLLTEPDYMNEDATRTPSFIRGNKFFGIPLTDSASNSPRIGLRSFRKSPLEKTEFASESMMESNSMNEDGDSILHHLKRQVRLDRKSLMALYMELDEERSASAVAANNAMAMITRLQAEKAAVQMEALQYQRMMEEQAEYDQEALQATNDMLVKREEDLKALHAEVEAYREKYGMLKEEDFKRRQDEVDEEYQQFKSHPYSFESSITSPVGSNGEETNGEFSHKSERAISLSSQGDNVRGNHNESLKDFKEEKTYLLGRKKLEKRSHISDTGGSSSPSASDGVDNIDDDPGYEGKSALSTELSHISEKVKALEAAGGSLDRAAEKLEKHSEGKKLLTEVSQSLTRLRHVMTMLSDHNDDE
ncbi:hypothetical protein FEM48_Zijuj05G0082800 [Ziziphus jujuba var. spinosa]|uniref:GTD-binding domain-containing protein n=1 Tax=Ziziphus jujuba var. spinosa TaxID=714518 RepID=A0A978VDV0_ZIZJJ|nr:hypothetical protein FEM48_Zijuj05G0082800 [Ziziphus jujuba var. spinosa]